MMAPVCTGFPALPVLYTITCLFKLHHTCRPPLPTRRHGMWLPLSIPRIGPTGASRVTGRMFPKSRWTTRLGPMLMAFPKGSTNMVRSCPLYMQEPKEKRTNLPNSASPGISGWPFGPVNDPGGGSVTTGEYLILPFRRNRLR